MIEDVESGVVSLHEVVCKDVYLLCVPVFWGRMSLGFVVLPGSENINLSCLCVFKFSSKLEMRLWRWLAYRVEIRIIEGFSCSEYFEGYHPVER